MNWPFIILNPIVIAWLAPGFYLVFQYEQLRRTGVLSHTGNDAPIWLEWLILLTLWPLIVLL